MASAQDLKTICFHPICTPLCFSQTVPPSFLLITAYITNIPGRQGLSFLFHLKFVVFSFLIVTTNLLSPYLVYPHFPGYSASYSWHSERRSFQGSCAVATKLKITTCTLYLRRNHKGVRNFITFTTYHHKVPEVLVFCVHLNCLGIESEKFK